jgi:hypothetical protein
MGDGSEMMPFFSFWCWWLAAQPVLVKCWISEQERERNERG